MAYKSGVQVLIPVEDIILGKNTRWDGIDQDKAEEYATSFEKVGQLQPVIVRPANGDKVELVLGFTRHAAAVIYNERNPDKPMKLKCVQVNCNAEEALEKNIIENRMRSDPTPMDDAYAQRRLREEFMWPDAKIAEFYQIAPSRVSQLKRLLSLSKKVQMQVHKRELSFRAAMELSGIENPDEVVAEEEAAVEEPSDAPHSNGKQRKKRSLSTRVLDKVREKKIERGGAVSRSLANVKNDLNEWIEALDGERRDLCKALLKYISGGLKAETMRKKIADLVK